MSHIQRGPTGPFAPGLERKRKLSEHTYETRKSSESAVFGSEARQDIQPTILLLETRILESRRNYNSIITLLEYMKIGDASKNCDILSAVALCRVFCKFMALGNLTNTADAPGAEGTITQWLKERLQEYEQALLEFLHSELPEKQTTALTLLMRLIKEKASHFGMPEDSVWRTGLFANLLQSLAIRDHTEIATEEFMNKYVGAFDDVRYYTYARIADLVSFHVEKVSVPNVLFILSAVGSIPEDQQELEDFFLNLPAKKKHDLYSLASHKKQAQRAWMAVLRLDLTKAQRKHILDLMSHRIAPWFLKVEMLMDFLTDSFDIGGSLSLMALSGLFYLIQQKNLDYPQFYLKLYSLLDANILHSKHRSRFFRLLDTFLASTHLPAALVASFIKRLSRLCLNAPPSGIVVVVPWIYNLLKNHPTCTFMIHRIAQLKGEDQAEMGDPFIMEESDPMETCAIESSLWEILTLQSHYHPNVAAIANIISEQFTKQAYNIEDFLDHSYGTMVDAELSKDIKKPPEIEYEIPKKIFKRYDSDIGKEDGLLTRLWNFS